MSNPRGRPEDGARTFRWTAVGDGQWSTEADYRRFWVGYVPERRGFQITGPGGVRIGGTLSTWDGVERWVRDWLRTHPRQPENAGPTPYMNALLGD